MKRHQDSVCPKYGNNIKTKLCDLCNIWCNPFYRTAESGTGTEDRQTTCEPLTATKVQSPRNNHRDETDRNIVNLKLPPVTERRKC